MTALALGPTQAGAHARLLHALPKVGATVSRAPAELRLWFSEAIEPAFSTITLSGADGRPATTGRLSLDPQDRRVAIVPIPVALPPAAYRVRWRVTSTDSHRTEGDFTFTIKP
ncbi:copper resistance protein CopC [Phenylobacterium sp.]|uniref:copper resistance CopC family protein n=1 Tax=Phenylobacterium sp. TaxID=1871053 RepID=UPI0025E3B0F6|nr:copper resistance protein CopC [Phenylobacterium sp.]